MLTRSGGAKGQPGETWKLMVNLIIGVRGVRANSTNIGQGITDKSFKEGGREEERRRGDIMEKERLRKLNKDL